MRFSPPLQVLERGPGGEVSESPTDILFQILGVLVVQRFQIELASPCSELITHN